MSPVSSQRTPNRSTGPARLMMMSGLSLAVLCASASAAAWNDSPLAGPDVETEQAETTLIDRNIDGSMRRRRIDVSAGRPIDASTHQRVDVSTRRRIDASTVRHVNPSTRRSIDASTFRYPHLWSPNLWSRN